MKILTNRFGEVDIEEGKIITFSQGILGFPDIKRYIVIDNKQRPEVPFRWLHAVDDPDLAFIITDPHLFYPDYNPEINRLDSKDLNIMNSSDQGIVVIITIPDNEPENMTANLKGPLLINLKTREAKQIVLSDDRYPVKSPLFKDNPVLK